MSTFSAKLLVLSVAFGWAAQVFSDDFASESNIDPTIHLIGPRAELEPASIPKKLLWAWTTLINPKYPNKPIPLYGYTVSTLKENTILDALSVAAAGDVHIAMLHPRAVDTKEGQSTGKTTIYEGQGVVISGKGNGTYDREIFAKKWEEFHKEYSHAYTGDEAIIAFTRPLDGKMIEDVPEAKEFVAWPSLWESDNTSAMTGKGDHPS